jgi:NADH:ubiquinone oxidoreductase subunit E
MKIEVKICMGSSCFARGNKQNLELLEEFIDQYNLEDKVELKGSCCEARCSDGPNIQIDGRNYQRVDQVLLLEILKQTFDIKV